MKIKQEPLQIEETYLIKENDKLIIKTNGKITHIIINGQEINFVTKVEFEQEIDGYAKIKLKRYFLQKDYKKIEPIFKEV